jgi:hypothetical protein
VTLQSIEQIDWAAGAIRTTPRHLIPDNGFYRGQNALLDDDGAAYRRGPAVYQATGILVSGGLRFVWDGHLIPGQRTLFASSSKFGTLLADNSVADLGGAGMAFPGTVAVQDGIVFLSGGVMYGGSRMTADYSTGTVTTTQGSKTITGSGTLWATAADAGMLMRFTGSSRYYVVQSVDSNTGITLAQPYEPASGAGLTYTLSRLGGAATHGAPVVDLYAASAGRLIAASCRKIQFSKGIDPATSSLRTHVWDADDVQEVPYGSEIVALATIRDQLLIFTTQGVWTLSNLAFNIVDAAGNPQQRLGLLDPGLVAWGNSGIAPFRTGVIVPGQDDIYLVDGSSPPEPISRGFTPLYREYVRLGHRPGGATVFNGHYFLPILDATAAVVDCLVVRVDRAVQTRLGIVFPMTQFTHGAGETRALARRSTPNSAGQLLSAAIGGRLMDLSNCFRPGVLGAPVDATGSLYPFEVETRSFRVAGTARRLRVRYELETAAGYDPAELSASISVGKTETNLPKWGAVNWGAFNWSDSSQGEYSPMSGVAPPSDGTKPYTFDGPSRFGHYVRYRITQTAPCQKLTLRSVEIVGRPTRKVT